MSLRLISAWLVCSALACSSGTMKVKKGEPQTAREKMLAEEKARTGADQDAGPPGSKKWAGWRYQGERSDCFFLVGRKCFKTEKAACAAAACKAPATCELEGAGPATVSCRGGTEASAKAEPAAEPNKGSAKKKK